MDPSEIEFIAECQTISIIPSFNKENVIHLICGDFGPFRAGYPQIVPLWLAVYLKQRRKCQIIPPEWMNVEALEEKKEDEKRSRYFTKMPSEHYMEIANILLDVCSEDMENCDVIRTAIKDLWDIRISKLRSSVDMFIKTGGFHAQLNYLTQLEINSIRPLLPDALNTLQKLNAVQDQDEEGDVASLISSMSVLDEDEVVMNVPVNRQDDTIVTPSSSGLNSTETPTDYHTNSESTLANIHGANSSSTSPGVL